MAYNTEAARLNRATIARNNSKSREIRKATDKQLAQNATFTGVKASKDGWFTAWENGGFLGGYPTEAEAEARVHEVLKEMGGC